MNRHKDDNGDEEEEEDYHKLIIARNRKQKRSGGWQAMGLDQPIYKAILKKGYRVPTPIQRKTIPSIIDGKDLVAMSRTGSGKTAAFIVPMLQKLKQPSTKGVRALLISPTRELALQTAQFLKELGRYTGLRSVLLVGGDSMEEQFSVIHQNPDIAIATPGRLLHVVVEMNLKLASVEYVVFDEADRLFEMGFADQLQEVLKRLPENRQTLLFSATLPKMLVDFVKAGLSDPMLVRLDVDSKISDKLRMVFLQCRNHDKLAALMYLIRELVLKNEQTIVFCATMKHVEHLVMIIEKANISCSYLYSQLDATARKINITRFRHRQTNLLIVTDVAARGVDIPLVENVINLHFPPKAKLFIHRVGRVARAGMTGTAYSLITADELPYLVDLFLFLDRPFPSPANDVKSAIADSIGSIPQTVIDSEIEYLKRIHEQCNELADLSIKSENAMSKYMRTRTQPSAESVRRVKQRVDSALFSAIYHPMFDTIGCEREELSRTSLLQGLRNYRPSATIFEIHNGGKQTQAAVMKAKRNAHQKYIKSKSTSNDTHPNEEASGYSSTLLRPIKWMIRYLQIVEIDQVHKEAKTSNKKSSQVQTQKDQYYVAYAPEDYRSEQALAVDRGFDEQMKESTFDMPADNSKDMHRQQQRMKWNRKLKRYVGESNDDGTKQKRIRTEEGTLLPASYKSGRYESWQKRQKIDDQRVDASDDDEIGMQQPDYPRNNLRSGVSQYRGGRRGRGGGNRFDSTMEHSQQQAYRSELRTKDQILKERRRKDRIQSYQSFRRRANASNGHSRGGGRGGGDYRRGGGDRRGGDRRGGDRRGRGHRK